MNKTKTIIALPLLAIIAAAGFALMAEEKVFAQPSSSNIKTVDQSDPKDTPDSPDEKINSVDNHDDGEQPDSTEK